MPARIWRRLSTNQRVQARVRNRRSKLTFRLGLPAFGGNVIFCVFCSIVSAGSQSSNGNRAGVHLDPFRSNFCRNAGTTSRGIIAIAVCDRCAASGAAPCADVSALQSISWVATLRVSIFGLTNWICFGDEAADDLFQTSIDPARRMRAFFRTVLGEMTWRLEP